MSALIQLLIGFIFVFFIHSLNFVKSSNSQYYKSLNERIEDLKNVYSNGKLDDNQTNVNFDDPDCNRSALEIITSKGYAGEVHYVTTSDGYILGIHRIPAPQNQKPDGRKKPAILLFHGLEACSVNFVTNMPNNSLGFMLADAGYDVWLGNSRGNTYSTAHEWLDPTNTLYWKFTWDEMAKYDLPATVDYILNVTEQEQIYYGGHSQGTMIGFAHFSSDVKFAQKIKAFFALAPTAHMGNSPTFKKAAPYVKQMQEYFAEKGYNDFLPYNGYYHKTERKYCTGESYDPKKCDGYAAQFIANNKLNESRIGVIMAHCPAGTSTQNMIHVFQMAASNQFQSFDYSINGTKRNQEHYNQDTPPIYDVSKLQVPTILFYSDADEIADPTDVAWLISQINDTVVEDYHYTDYTHLDFIWALRPAEDVYPHIINYIKQHEPPEATTTAAETTTASSKCSGNFVHKLEYLFSIFIISIVYHYL